MRRRRGLWMAAALMGILAAGAAVIRMLLKDSSKAGPDQLLAAYMGHIPEQEYEEMYGMVDLEASGNISLEDFVRRNSAIYEGIEARNMAVGITSYEEGQDTVQYQTSLDTAAGNIRFENEAHFTKGKDGYKLVWRDSLIFPELGAADRVEVQAVRAERGELLDRDGRILAGEGAASLVGIVPGKLEDRGRAIEDVAKLLGMEPEGIEKELSAGWVTDDSFVPVKTIRKIGQLELMSPETGEEAYREQERQQRLLEIPGVMITDTSIRTYPLGSAAAHLVGYVQDVTAEDLENHSGEGYTAGSLIGRSGLEGRYESQLKGRDGCRISIVDSDGNEKAELASRMAEHGQDIKLTIDAGLQCALYEAFKEDRSCSVAMNPYTGEVLALVSTPSYDNNDFITGLSDEAWAALSEDGDRPLDNRFRQAWCPGSTFKPVIAAVGLQSGAVNPGEDYGNEGESWQKDASWGSYHVTTLHAYEPVILENALIYSDNIYFAKAALKMGAEGLETALSRLGFQEELPFEILMAKSQYSNTEHIETEIQLADSGYGQGQVLVNPLHLACIYTAFCNKGNVIKPRLLDAQGAGPEFWIPNAFSENTAATVLEGLEKAVNEPEGTGYAAHREDVILAGKTGTAEIKASQEDTSGTELGWFAVFTGDAAAGKPVLIISMAEGVKEKGGSGYVVGKDSRVLDTWFGRD